LCRDPLQGIPLALVSPNRVAIPMGTPVQQIPVNYLVPRQSAPATNLVTTNVLVPQMNTVMTTNPASQPNMLAPRVNTVPYNPVAMVYPNLLVPRPSIQQVNMLVPRSSPQQPIIHFKEGDSKT
jgi:hypothetical protein